MHLWACLTGGIFASVVIWQLLGVLPIVLKESGEEFVRSSMVIGMLLRSLSEGSLAFVGMVFVFLIRCICISEGFCAVVFLLVRACVDMALLDAWVVAVLTEDLKL